VVPERDVDPAELYELERVAFASYLLAQTGARADVAVPATPGWGVRDVLAHLVGITADLNHGRFGDGDGDAWTAAQVVTRRGRPMRDVVAEWDREAPTFEDGLRLFGYAFGAHYLGDLLQHVVDVHVALDEPWIPPDLHLAVALDFYLTSFEEALDDAAVGAVDVRVGDERWRLGTGRAVASVEASRVELFRALGGRRTGREVRSLRWDGDVHAVIDLVSRYPTPPASLGEALDHRAGPR
jgi:uncharacterized protein (TIGR03083 family)